MKEIFLLKCGELILKGLNRGRFEQQLMSNMKRRLKPHGNFQISSKQSTIYVEPADDANADAAFDALTRVFGLAALCRAPMIAKELPAIIDCAVAYLAAPLQSARTFKVESKRADKRFALTSPQISSEVGAALLDAYPHLRVDVHKPDVTVYVEIRERYAYVHTTATMGAGGLPVGVSGRAALLLSGGIDSPVAGYMMAKRGLEILPIHFYSYPYTGEESKEKVLTLARLMGRYTGRHMVSIVPFTAIQEALRKTCPESLYTLVMRRFMMRIATRLAHDNGCGALVTGECLGQVASQTMGAMAVTEAVCDLPVLRPCVGMDKEEIVTVARKIGTFETSILPFEDCCTVFTPRHPKTNPTLAEVEAAEVGLEIDALVTEAVMKTEKVKLW